MIKFFGRRPVRNAAGMLAGLAAFQFGGCITRAQWTDFFFTEVARVAADITGQVFLILIQAVSPLAAA